MKFLIATLLVCLLSACDMSSSKNVPPGILIYEDSIRSVPIQFEDPSVRQKRENGYQIAMIYVREGDLIAPIFYMRMPKVGGGTRMKHLDIVRAASDGQDFLYYADDKNVSKVIFLVQGISLDKRGWRVHEVDVSQGFRTLNIPPLETLKPVEELENYQEIIDLLDTAKSARFDLNS